MCDDLKGVMNDTKQQILKSSASMYSKEYQEDLVYDLEQARTDTLQWKLKPTFAIGESRQGKARHHKQS